MRAGLFLFIAINLLLIACNNQATQQGKGYTNAQVDSLVEIRVQERIQQLQAAADSMLRHAQTPIKVIPPASTQIGDSKDKSNQERSSPFKRKSKKTTMPAEGNANANP
jgi:hypothetical protein